MIWGRPRHSSAPPNTEGPRISPAAISHTTRGYPYLRNKLDNNHAETMLSINWIRTGNIRSSFDFDWNV